MGQKQSSGKLRKSALHEDVASMKDWWWVADSGLLHTPSQQPADESLKKQILVSGKSLVLIMHTREQETKEVQTYTIVIEPNKDGAITLGMLSDGLLKGLPNVEGKEYGIESLEQTCEDAFAVVIFLGFDG